MSTAIFDKLLFINTMMDSLMGNWLAVKLTREITSLQKSSQDDVRVHMLPLVNDILNELYRVVYEYHIRDVNLIQQKSKKFLKENHANDSQQAISLQIKVIELVMYRVENGTL